MMSDTHDDLFRFKQHEIGTVPNVHLVKTALGGQHTEAKTRSPRFGPRRCHKKHARLVELALGGQEDRTADRVM